MKNKTLKTAILLACLGLGGMALSGCAGEEEGAGEEAGKKLDEAADKAGEAAEEAGEAAKDAGEMFGKD